MRFPNSQSDVDRFVQLFTVIAEGLLERGTFDLDDMRDVLAARLEISSMGASGAAAVQRSTREDRSRDPLYNQVKMMSEIFRMLGWLRSTPGSRLNFTITNLGAMVALDAASHGEEFRRSLVRESILSVVFPNATTTNLGVSNSRPFVGLLRLAHAVGGLITRDEIILGVLAVTDDRGSDAHKNAVKRVRSLRSGSREGLAKSVEALAKTNQVQTNTLQNYTRLPIGVLSSATLGWATPESVSGLYGPRPIRAFRLTEVGMATAEGLAKRKDIRAADVGHLSLSVRADLANFGYYEMLDVSGIQPALIADERSALESAVADALRAMGVAQGQRIIYNPELQEPDEVLELALEEPAGTEA